MLLPFCLLLCLILVAIGGLLFLATWCQRLGAQLRRIPYACTQDPLTGLPNGHLFETERWPAALRASGPLAVLYVDLDDLKQLNDGEGRFAGDRHIARAAEKLRLGCRRGVDPVFRLHPAGDEFVVLLHGRDAFFAVNVAEQLRGHLCSGGISASIGVAFTDSADHRLRNALLTDAENAVRQAKRAGKCRVTVWASPSPASPTRHEAVPEPIEEESKVRSTLKVSKASSTSTGGDR